VNLNCYAPVVVGLSAKKHRFDHTLHLGNLK